MPAPLQLLLGVIALFLLAGSALLWWSRRLRTGTGLPQGQVVYSDTGAWQRVEEPLISRRHGLVGRPDYLVEVKEGRRHITVPVEVKSRARPEPLYAGHLLQLGVYCLLVEESTKVRPPYGYLRYRDATVQVPFTDDLRRAVLVAAEEIRRARSAPRVDRSHEEPARCRNCGYLHACGADALAEG